MARELTSQEKQALQSAVNANPTAVYKRVKYLYPSEAPKFGNGFEKVDSSKSTIIRFLTMKAEASPNPQDFLQSL